MGMEMEMARCVLVICGTMWSRGKGPGASPGSRGVGVSRQPLLCIISLYCSITSANDIFLSINIIVYNLL